MARKLTDEQREMFEEFNRAFQFCWGCGIDSNDYRDVERERSEIDYPRWGERHHLIKMCRVHERWNISLLCKLCHDLAEMHTVRVDTEPLPYLKLEHVLWLKREFDPEHYLPEEMAKYSIRRIPEPVLPPPWFTLQLMRRRRIKLDIHQYAEEKAKAAQASQ